MRGKRILPTVRFLIPAIGALVLALLLAGCGEQPLLSEVSFSKDRITPNADGQDDVLVIRYRLARAADLSIYFLDEAGNRYIFRDRQPRAPRASGSRTPSISPAS